MILIKHAVLPSSSRRMHGDDIRDDVVLKMTRNQEEQIRQITPSPKEGNPNNKAMSHLIYLATSKTWLS